MADDDRPSNSAEESREKIAKLKLEQEKLKYELKELSRPFYFKPANLISCVTIVSLLFQWRVSAGKAERAEKEAQKAEQTVNDAEIKLSLARQTELQVNNNLLLLNQAKAKLEDRVRMLEQDRDTLEEKEKELAGKIRMAREVLTAQEAQNRKVEDSINTVCEALPTGSDPVNAKLNLARLELKEQGKNQEALRKQLMDAFK
jgi:hypothetical protein